MAASRAAGRSRLPWLAADVPKVIRAPCPVRGMAGLSPGVARSPHLCGWLRAFGVSRSPHGVRWPGLPHATTCVRLHVSPRFNRLKSCWNPRVLARDEARCSGKGCYTPGRIGAPLLGVPALQGLTGRSCCGFRRCSPLALGRAARADAGASGYRRIVQRRWNLSARAATPSWAFFPLASCACDGLRRVCRSLAGCRVHW